MINHDLFQVADNVIDEVIKSLPEKDNTGKSGVTEKLPETNNMAHVLLTRIIVTLVDCAEMLQFDRYFFFLFFICSQSDIRAETWALPPLHPRIISRTF